MIKENQVMTRPDDGWEAVDKTARLLMQRAKYLNLPPDQFRYLVMGEVDQKITEAERFKKKFEIERKYRRKAEFELKKLMDHIARLESRVSDLGEIIEMQDSIISDLDD